MRISDWSSDVCSSDLFLQVRQEAPARLVVGVAHVVAGLNALAGEVATSCHGLSSWSGKSITGQPQPPGAGWFLRQGSGEVKANCPLQSGGTAPSPSRFAGPSLPREDRKSTRLNSSH